MKPFGNPGRKRQKPCEKRFVISVF